MDGFQGGWKGSHGRDNVGHRVDRHHTASNPSFYSDLVVSHLRHLILCLFLIDFKSHYTAGCSVAQFVCLRSRLCVTTYQIISIQTTTYDGLNFGMNVAFAILPSSAPDTSSALSVEMWRMLRQRASTSFPDKGKDRQHCIFI